MKIKSLLAVTLLFLASSAMANVDACVEDKINAYRAEVGQEAVVRYDMLEEWEGECNGGGADVCLDKKIEAYRDEVGQDAVVGYDMIEEWEGECAG